MAKINECYADFETRLGESDQKFLKNFKTPTRCLIEIDDVVNELTMIKRVQQDQALVWQALHSKRSYLTFKCTCQNVDKPHKVQRVSRKMHKKSENR